MLSGERCRSSKKNTIVRAGTRGVTVGAGKSGTLMSNQAGDIVPSIGGTPPQSASSKDLGDELDLTAKYGIGPRSNVLLGYSHFWRGNKILAPKDADFTYIQWELNF